MRRKYTPTVRKNKNKVIKGDSKRAKVLNSIKDYYSGLKMSENIRNIKLNSTKYWRNEQHLWESDIKKIYEKYNIAYYNNKEEFYKAKEPYQLTDIQKKTLWEDYEYRHKLIISGQYEEYRSGLFRDNYIKAMERLGATDKELQILRNIPISNWTDLEILPQPEKDNTRDKQLPPLGTFHYEDKSLLNEVRKDLKYILKEQFDIDYDWDDNSVIGNALKKSRALLGSMDKLSREEYESYNEVEKYDYIINHVDDSKLIKTKPDKHGNSHYYIRGVGSEVGKNSQLIKDILKAKGK